MNSVFLFVLIYTAVFINANDTQHVRRKRIVGGEPAGLPQVDRGDVQPDADSVVFIYENDKRARVSGFVHNDRYYAFLGIRYAEPPTGVLRLQRPVFLYMEGNITATRYGPPCLQPNKDESGTVGSEDCLYLNVYTPSIDQRNASGLPVLFWIHGGGFRRGSGNQYGVSSLVSKRVVVVTMSYRLGTLGWLGSTNKQLPGNSAIFDIRAALEWTRRYISFFGGDPEKIYTGGQGVGASVANLFAQSIFTSYMVKGVFAMSGTAMSSTAIDYNPNNTTFSVTTAVRCINLAPLETVRCLQQITNVQILNSDTLLQGSRVGKEGFISALTQLISAGPVVEGCDDGRFLQFFLNDPPLEYMKHRPRNNPPMLIGVTKHETGKSILGRYRNDVLTRLQQIPNFLNQYLPLSMLNANTGLFTDGSVNRLLQSLFSNNEYLNLIFSSISSALTELEKVMEATTDALFNLPAVTTSSLWQKAGGDVYFYSFEHVSASSQAQYVSSNHFLDGLPLISPSTSTSDKPVVSHGDDLIYLFEKQTLEGRPIPQAILADPKDLRVRNMFTTLVTEFLHNGKPRLPQLNQEWPLFENTRSEYVALSENPRVLQGFRLCQMALWGGFVENLQSASCKFPGIDRILSTIPSSLLDDSLLSQSSRALLGGITDMFSSAGQSGSALLGKVGDTSRLVSSGTFLQPTRQLPQSPLSQPAGGLGVGSFSDPLGVGGTLGGNQPKQQSSKSTTKSIPKTTTSQPGLLSLGGGSLFG